MTLKRTISQFCLFSCGLSVQADDQDLKAFNLYGQVYELNLEDSEEKPVMGISIEVWTGDKLITQHESGSKGKYSIHLPYYPIYQIMFGKTPYITKIIEINAKGFSRAAEYGIMNFSLDVSVFKDENFMGLDFMNYTPVAKLYLNKSKGEIQWDDKYCSQMNARMTGILQANGKTMKRKKKK